MVGVHKGIVLGEAVGFVVGVGALGFSDGNLLKTIIGVSD